MKWQNSFIKKLIEIKGDSFFLDAVKNDTDLINSKNDRIPYSLIKFYAPTYDNIQDIENQRIWLASPSSFNDPFDCNIGYNISEFTKYKLFKQTYQDKSYLNLPSRDCFTIADLSIMRKTYTFDSDVKGLCYGSNKKPFDDVLYEILKGKTQKFTDSFKRQLQCQNEDVDAVIKNARTQTVRIACFSELESYDGSEKNMLMWSHYASSHSGFCVEYDISPLKKDMSYSIPYNERFLDVERFTNERLSSIIKAGLLPVTYTNKRTLIPKTIIEQSILNYKNNVPYNNKFKEKILLSFLSKSTVWNYEKEWRLIVDNKICEYYDNKIPFPYIKAIYVGLNATKELVKTLYRIE